MSRPTLAAIPLLLILLLVACRPTPAPVMPAPRGRELAALPTASSAPVFAPTGGHYAEAVFRDGRWQIYAEGKPVDDATTREEVEKALKTAKERANMEGHVPVLLISADVQTPFSQITASIKAAVTCGIERIHVLVVSTAPGGSKTCSYALPLSIFFPIHDPAVESLSIVITDTGEIAAVSGATRQILDSATACADLPGLDARLRLYATPARAASSPSSIEVRLQPSIPYQRFIDVFCRFRANDICPNFIADEDNGPAEVQPSGKPTPPSSSK